MRRLIFSAIMALSSASYAEQSRVVVITGASRGLGLATAKCLSENGFTVYGTTRTPPAQSLENIHFLQVDMQDGNSIKQAIETVLDKEGHVDVLINNAGYAVVGPVESLTDEEMHEQMEVNFFAPIKFIQAVLPAMRKAQSGHIINISSVNAFQTPPFGSLYAASKSALESLSESLAIEVQPHNIAVSIVEPGLIQTRFALPVGTREIPNNPYKAITDQIAKDLEERFAHPELLSPSQTGKEVAEFLLSIIQDPHSKLRYQTSDDAREMVAKKLIDLTGDLFLEDCLKVSEEN